MENKEFYLKMTVKANGLNGSGWWMANMKCTEMVMLGVFMVNAATNG